jgi:hypothetical protein
MSALGSGSYALDSGGGPGGRKTVRRLLFQAVLEQGIDLARVALEAAALQAGLFIKVPRPSAET